MIALIACLIGAACAGGLNSGLGLADANLGYGAGALGYGGYGAGALGYGAGLGYGSNLGYGAGLGRTSSYQFRVDHPPAGGLGYGAGTLGYGAGALSYGAGALGYGAGALGYGGYGVGLGYGSGLGYGAGLGYGSNLGYGAGLGRTSSYQFRVDHPPSRGAYGAYGAGYGANYAGW